MDWDIYRPVEDFELEKDLATRLCRLLGSKNYVQMDKLRQQIIDLWRGYFQVSYINGGVEVFNKGYTINALTIKPKTFWRRYV